MSNRCFIGVIIFCALSSCSSKKDEAQKTLVEMSRHKVVLPLGEMGCFHSTVDTLERKVVASGKYTYVHYVDSSQCSPCALIECIIGTSWWMSIRKKELLLCLS